MMRLGNGVGDSENWGKGFVEISDFVIGNIAMTMRRGADCGACNEGKKMPAAPPPFGSVSLPQLHSIVKAWSSQFTTT